MRVALVPFGLVIISSASMGPARAQETSASKQASPFTMPPGTETAAMSSGTVASKDSGGFARIPAPVKATAQRSAGATRDVDALGGSGPNAKEKSAHPAPTPLVLRKMAVDRAVAAIEPAVRACASESGSTVAV